MKNIDKYYGIQKHNEKYIMGDKEIDIKDNDIHVNGKIYNGTPGLWQLIMLSKPASYTPEDFRNYENLVEDTQVIFNPQTISPRDQPKRTSKYKDLLRQLEKNYESEEEEVVPKKRKISGEGIVLPGDISGLFNRLRLVSAERRAGNNISTTAELVAILDELLRKKVLSQEEYNAICKREKC